MISKLKGLEKYFNYLLVFLFPTQLALHFWPDFAFVFGIRVDYLAPAIYLTDILFLALFTHWAIKSTNLIARSIKKNKNRLLLLALFVLINTVFSSLPFVTLIKWLKILELILVCYYFQKRSDIFEIKTFVNILFTSLLFFSLLGITQFIKGSTIGGVLYYLGERKFSLNTPGIALVGLFGRSFFRVYSTFPHPNAFAGFLGVFLILAVIIKTNVNRLSNFIAYLLILVAFIMTFSLSAFLGLITIIVVYKLFRKKMFSNNLFTCFLMALFVVSFCLALFSGVLLKQGPSFGQSVGDRLKLANTSLKVVNDNWLFGLGLNTFIPDEIAFTSINKGVWLLQPVHNVYLLTFVEVGLLGTVVVYLLLSVYSRHLIKNKNNWGIFVLAFVLLTGLMDHYWLTIQQNLLLLASVAGLSLQQKR